MTWDTLDTQPYCNQSGLVAISGGGLTATGGASLSATNQGLAQPFEGKSSGKWCVEFHCIAHGTSTYGIPSGDCIGVVGSEAICKAGGNSYGFIGGDGGAGASGQFGIGYRQDSGDINYDHLYLIGQHPIVTWSPAWQTGDYVYLALDLDNDKFWWRINGGPWLGLTNTGDPAAGTGGIPLSSYPIYGDGKYWPAVSMGHNGVYTFNFGATAFASAAPSGFTAGWTNTNQPRFGSRLSNGLGGFSGTPRLIVSPYVCPFDGSITALHGGNASTALGVGVIYDSDGAGGGPGTLLAHSAPTGATSAGSADYALLVALAVTTGHTYWLGVFLHPNGPYCDVPLSGGAANGLWNDATATWPTPNSTFAQSSQSANHVPMVASGSITPPAGSVEVPQAALLVAYSVTKPPLDYRRVAWTFDLDGHKMWVCDFGDEGTWMVDLTTKQWNHPTTQGFTQWNITAGLVWNNRIVGGDLYNPILWELDPTAVKDEGFRDIFHACTGGVATRSRKSISCDAFRLSASIGYIDNVAGATMSLRWSDDNENTWSPYYTKVLMPGPPFGAGFSAELAWQALGSFMAPGRIFEITDTGGLIRIDGADAGLGDFDEDTAPQGPPQNVGR